MRRECDEESGARESMALCEMRRSVRLGRVERCARDSDVRRFDCIESVVRFVRQERFWIEVLAVLEEDKAEHVTGTHLELCDLVLAEP